MPASSPRSAGDAASVLDPSIDELDAEICTLASQLNERTYRMLVLVHEFDDRMGWAKWGSRSCAEWLTWRCGMSLSAAREKVRTAQALRTLPALSMAFADGRLSYTKVRALTRVAHLRDEDSLLDYALRVTAPQVEERCRQSEGARASGGDGRLGGRHRVHLRTQRQDPRFGDRTVS
jgi:hypothetical protein